MQQKVLIYTIPTCEYCQMAKDYMRAHNIEYEEVKLEEQRGRVREVIQKSGQMGVPVIVVTIDNKEEVIVGFDRPRMAKILQILE